MVVGDSLTGHDISLRDVASDVDSVQMVCQAPDMNTVQTSSRPENSAVPTLSGTTPGRLEAFGELIVGRRRAVLVLFLMSLLAFGGLGSQLFSRLASEGFDDSGSQSAAAASAMKGTFGVSDPVVVLAVQTATGVDEPAAVADANALIARVAKVEGVSQVLSYWTSGKPGSLGSRDGSTGLVLIYRSSDSTTKAAELAKTLTKQFAGSQASLTVYAGGAAVVGNALTDTITADLSKAESIAIPITVILLIVVFGSLVSAGLPFLVAGGAILGAFAVVWGISLTTDVSVFALNLITGLGLGLGIDYALLMVNRYREELGRGLDPHAAATRTVATAGRTVIFSGATVSVVLAALLFFPQYFLKSFAYAGISVTLLAVFGTLTALPAVLAMLGHKLDRFAVRRGGLAPSDDGMWARIARTVMRFPVPVLIVVLGVLLTVAAPALSVKFGPVDARALPADNPAAVASKVISDSFDGQAANALDVVVPGGASSPATVTSYAVQLSQLAEVAQVVTPTGVVAGGRVVSTTPQPGTWSSGGDVRLSVLPQGGVLSRDGQDVVAAVRAVPAPGTGSLVGGQLAFFADSQSALAHRGVWALVWILIATLVVLFLFTGSVVLPIKAVLLNVLSLGATLGALVWVFQEEHLGWLVGSYTGTGTIDTSMKILIAVVAFALSMDYEVFLVSRIKEVHDQGEDTETSVVFGLQRSGRIITAAALLLAVVFASFVSSGVTSIKQLGFGVAFAILLDATVVRGLLVPAIMRLAGRWNWWAPQPLAALHARFGFSES